MRRVGAAGGAPAGQPAACRCRSGRARLDAALAVHQLARAAAPCDLPAPAAVLLAVDAAPFYLWNFLGRRGPAPLLLIAQPATCARSAPLVAHQLASLQHAAARLSAPASMPSALARANFSAAGRCAPWIWQTAPREACRPAPWACTSWRARERPAARQRPPRCCWPSMPPRFTCGIFSAAVDRRRCS
ncbi:hypothetical protein [Janthinobacterium sp. HH102]|uniref:hypothetical protein n=1 Tax=Janthinobacterium sp. HH102 TaxID=1537274 RepID=UPI001585D903|nr:hypothetical protein [Janthinobacterium sp. HH102]